MDMYHHLLHCFPDVRSLVEPVARIEEIQRVQFVLFKRNAFIKQHLYNFLSLMAPSYAWVWPSCATLKALISGC